MNHLAEYYSDDDSPYEKTSEEHLERSKSDEEHSPSKENKVKRKEGRRDSEYWTDDSVNEKSSSSPDRSTRSISGDNESTNLLPPPPSKKALISSTRRSVKNDLNKFAPHMSFASQSRISMTQSQTSLVSYDEQDDEEDQFAKADRKAVARKESEKKGSESTNREPKPPPGHEDSHSPDDIAVHNNVGNNLKELDRHQIVHNTGPCLTPGSAEGNDSPQIHDEIMEIRLPPSPSAKCPPELEARFRGFFERKAQGADLNALIQKRRDFRNPSMYEKLIEKFEVDELGSNFAPSVFDPHGFAKDCFYDQISILQKEIMEKYNAAAEKKATTAGSVKAGEVKRKSRFEGTIK
ncbi:unnamed protein product [Thelazia callipaeda]|uniref:SAP30-binding protein n=1 Tax=Thelazia callipaeda TaxID=103827 RepID=A0A0N5CM28_THECL|nr:unnamed protein product [Thelazia callipaeda]